MSFFAPDGEGWRSLLRRVAAATNASDPEDLLQAAFVRLAEYRARATVDNPRAFLVKVAINLAHDERRSASRRQPSAYEDAETLTIVDDQPLQDEVVAAKHRLALVREALAELSPRTREIFLMHRVEQLKYREIAGRFGITVSAVEKHVAKAVLLLAQRMQDG